jgi:exopolysaccharide biosynthesis polyprenyl glycosylphosphotransferase
LRKIAIWIRLQNRNLRYLVIVGTNQRAVALYKRIIETPELGYKVKGFVDDDWKHIREFKRLNENIVSNIKGFKEYLRKNIVDEVIITLPLNSHYRESSYICKLCEEQGITVKNIANLYNLNNGQSDNEFEESNYFITNYTSTIAGWKSGVKRLIDLFISGFGLIILFPFMLFIAVCIKISSPGPALFIQKRIGLNKREFSLYKFRTMEINAEDRICEIECLNEAAGPVFKISNDPRVTKIGKILRKFSIDELPQLLNVYKGDMSLVGPRPLPIRDYNGFTEDWHRKRFSIRPGLTCLWQINGRSNVEFEEWMKLDMKYIDQWSLSMDLKIILKTIPVIILGTGAV